MPTALAPSPALRSPAFDLPNTAQLPRIPRRPPTKMDARNLVSCLLVILFVWRWHEMHIIIGLLKVPILVTGAGIVLMVLDKAHISNTKILRDRVFYCCIGIAAIVAVGMPFSLWPRAAFDFLTKDHARTLLNMVLIATSIRDMADVKRIIAALVVGGGWYCVLIMLYGLDWEGFAYYDENDLALALAVTVPFIIFLMAVVRKWIVKLALLATAGLYLTIIIMTSSRGGFLGLVAVGLGYLFVMGTLPKYVRIGSVVVMAIGVAVGGKVLPDNPAYELSYWDRMSTILNPSEDYNWAGQAESGRVEVWKRGVGYMLSRPVLGVGARNFTSAEGHLSPQAQRRQPGFKWSAAHNSYVQIGAELGVGGLMLFLYRFVLMFRVLKKGRRASRGKGRSRREGRLLGETLTVATIAFIVAGVFLSQAYAVILHVIIGLVLTYPLITKTERHILVFTGLGGNRDRSAHQTRPMLRTG